MADKDWEYPPFNDRAEMWVADALEAELNGDEESDGERTLDYQHAERSWMNQLTIKFIDGSEFTLTIQQTKPADGQAWENTEPTRPRHRLNRVEPPTPSLEDQLKDTPERQWPK